MAGVQTTSNLSNSIRARYQNAYEEQIFADRVYDQIAAPVGKDMSKFIAGSSIVFPFISKMDPGTTAISESSDVQPQTLVDGTVSVTPTSRGEALQQSELLRIQNYAENFEEEVNNIIRENATESIDLLAQAQALKGSVIQRATARASLDAGTAAHNFGEDEFAKVANRLFEFKVPMWMNGGQRSWIAMLTPDTYHDLRTTGNIVEVAKYQNQNILFNNELGAYDNFRIVVAPWAKVFGGAGADNGSNADTTLSAAATKLDKTITVASNTNLTSGRYITIGTEETGDTHYETNERVYVASVSGTTITIVGQGSNGGLRFNHASGVAVRNADSVHPVVFAGKGSIKKWWAPSVGPYGMVMPEKTDGLLDQWFSRGWKFYGAYARPIESKLARGEYSASLDA